MSAAASARGSIKHYPAIKRYGYTWVTAVLFLLALIGQWWLAWSADVDEQRLHGAEPDLLGFFW